jgi:MarR family transcriptional regulator, transcriptional regulator for hemolysin
MAATPPVPRELTDNLCWLLSRTAQGLNARLTDAMHGLGFPARTHQVLQAAATGEHTQIELARMVGLDKTTLVATIDQAERLGLAERVPSPTDRRVRIIRVTDEGREKLAEADVILSELKGEVLGEVREGDRDGLLRGLEALAEALR